MNSILLSICIPTNGRPEILKRTLNSIYSEAEDFSEFEVLVSDNSADEGVKEVVNNFYKYPNFFYYRTNVAGFLNSLHALNVGRGLLLKLHNNYSEFRNNSLVELLQIVREWQNEKPLLFFSNNSLKLSSVHTSFDDFLYTLSYYSSWSTGFSIWRQDLLRLKNSEINHMFPQTSLLLKQYDKQKFVIENKFLFYNQNVPNKGGYNLFYVFCVVYVNLLLGSFEQGHISHKTFSHLKKDMYRSFIIPWYYYTKVRKNDYKYDLTGIKESLIVHYSIAHYYFLIGIAGIIYPMKGTLSKLYYLTLNKVINYLNRKK